jgi:hypothetical protein
MARWATYEHLLRLNAGFEQVQDALSALSRNEQFDRTELRRLGAWSEEARASINSYLASVIEGTATGTAGRLYRRRLARERKEESG